MTNRYRCGPEMQIDKEDGRLIYVRPRKLKQTRKMTNRYRCDLNSNWKWTDRNMTINMGATLTQTELTWWMTDRVAQSQRNAKIMMQTNSVGGDIPQYDNSWGSTTRSKDNKACERSDDPREGGYAPVCNSQGSTTRSRGEWNLLKGLALSGNEVCPSMQLAEVNN